MKQSIEGGLSYKYVANLTATGESQVVKVSISQGKGNIVVHVRVMDNGIPRMQAIDAVSAVAAGLGKIVGKAFEYDLDYKATVAWQAGDGKPVMASIGETLSVEGKKKKKELAQA